MFKLRLKKSQYDPGIVFDFDDYRSAVNFLECAMESWNCNGDPDQNLIAEIWMDLGAPID